jgi:alkyl hydroperoxide reductase subunit AhpC
MTKHPTFRPTEPKVPSTSTNELAMAGLYSEFVKRNCKIIGLSADPVSSHGKWAVDIERLRDIG